MPRESFSHGAWLMRLQDARMAIVHKWMVHCGGGVERVAAALRELYPEADHFALVHDGRRLRV
jgi:hypothetical protein